MISYRIYKLIFVIVSLIFTSSVWASSLKAIRVWPSPESTRIVLDVDSKINYKVITLDNPKRVVIDCSNTKLMANLKNISTKGSQIKRIRSASHPGGRLRIVFEVTDKFHLNHFILEPNKMYGHRVVLDLESDQKQEILALFDLDDLGSKEEQSLNSNKTGKTDSDIPNSGSKPKITLRNNTKFIVAIDPGHGGEDPGAVGPTGLKEKDVALSIAKHLKQKINQEKNMQAILIRNGDYYIGLRERMRRARSKGADLFISIHADAFNNPKARGASVFILSERGASSSAARWLAASENRADLIGGVSLNDKSQVLASVLLDLSQAANEKASFAAAKHVLYGLSKNSTLHKTHVERAGFAVLKALDMPSILVESGFISHPATEKQLAKNGHRVKIADSILFGVKEYYKHTGSKHK